MLTVPHAVWCRQLNPGQAVRKQEAYVVLRISSDYGRAWRKGEPVQVDLFHDSSQRDANTSV